MKLRSKSKTSIQYILIADGSPMISTFIPPDAIKDEVIEFLKRSPIDLLQVRSSLDFYESAKKSLWSEGYDLNVLNIEGYHVMSEFIESSERVQLFFLNGAKDSHLNLFTRLFSNSNDLRFFHFYNKEYPSEDHRIVKNPKDFIAEIVSRQESLLTNLGAPTISINPSLALEYKDYNTFYYFIPTAGNYHTINSLIGNYGAYRDEGSEEEMNKKFLEESTKAHREQNSFNRQLNYLTQIERIDFFNILCYNEDLVKPTTVVEPILSPLILVLPFHNPDVKDFYPDKDLVDSFQAEQTPNYINEVNKKDSIPPEMYIAGMNFLRIKAAYLDNIAFLHSSFSFSLIIRFPMKGKSIYRELSFFRTDFFPNVSRAKNRKKLKKTIYSFGRALKDQILSDELAKVIKKRNGQIVCISDLPIEWLLIDNIPLSFTHDICRLPETSLHGLMSFYISNTTTMYSIPENVLEKTLVIMGTSEESFKIWQDQAYELSNDKKFLIRECQTLEDVKRHVQSIKPDILIFDCHGGYDKETKTTFLYIGNEKLDGNFVVENQITAPIVFLSACGTAPTYGTINVIANAFFEVGALSVTSTYMPITVNSGSILYLRLLNKLEFAAKSVIHKNWLEFVSHVIRTSSINDAYMMALNKNRDLSHSEWINSNTKSLTDSMIFGRRRKLFHELNKTISKFTNDQRKFFSETIPEYLLYSTLGRADLILFENWAKAHKDKNK